MNNLQKVEQLHRCFKLCDILLTDSREVSKAKNEGKKAIFFALKGDKYDANDFVEDVLNDAEFIVTSRKDISDSSKILVVDDTLKALQQLAAYHRNQLDCKLIAITGSNGKTTTKELLVSILSTKYNIAYTKGNFNNHIGVPLTLLSIKENDEIAIVEHGANHIDEIEFLVNLSKPNFGIITNIGRAHIGEFNGITGIIKAKGELYDYLKNNNGLAFYNNSLPYLSEMVEERKNMQTISYSESILTEVDNVTNKGIVFKYSGCTINSHLIGSYNSYNLSAAIVIAKYFGIENASIKSAIESYIPSNMRSQLLTTQRNKIILDAYNANPSSMAVAIDDFISKSYKNSVYILGDMQELGNYSEDEHILLAEKLSKLSAEIILVGNNFKSAAMKYNLNWFLSVDDLINSSILNKFTNCNILIKGSRMARMEKVIDYL